MFRFLRSLRMPVQRADPTRAPARSLGLELFGIQLYLGPQKLGIRRLMSVQVAQSET